MNLNYHIHKSDIICPYCDKECSVENYGVARDLEEKIELECEHCEKIFWAESCIVYNTYSDCGLNNEEHKFKNDCDEYPTVFNCQNCQKCEVRDNQELHPTEKSG